MARRVLWGTLTVILDNEQFQQAYTLGREAYFDTCEEESCQAQTMTVRQVMDLVAIPNGTGGYQFDDDPTKAEEILGFTLGYMSGAFIPETPEERDAWEHCSACHTAPLSMTVL